MSGRSASPCLAPLALAADYGLLSGFTTCVPVLGGPVPERGATCRAWKRVVDEHVKDHGNSSVVITRIPRVEHASAGWMPAALV